MSGIYESVPATAEEVEVFAGQLTEAYLHCRVWGHDPDPQGNTRLATDDDRTTPKTQSAYWVANPGCTHGCGVRWVIHAAIDGTLLNRALDYSNAPDYLSEHGRIDSTGRAILRREYFLRDVGEKRQVQRVRKPRKSVGKRGKR